MRSFAPAPDTGVVVRDIRPVHKQDKTRQAPVLSCLDQLGASDCLACLPWLVELPD